MPEIQSEFFTLGELTASDYAARHCLDNTPDEGSVGNLSRLVANILDPLRRHLKVPIIVTSGYRSPELNKAVGGSPKSQHTYGLAADIRVGGKSPRLVALAVHDMYRWGQMPSIDQCILEFDSWVHVSTSDEPRHQFLEASKIDGRTHYAEL